ncbi:hypothetical protein E3T55_11440 [Cryobacterium frigoriphilum]|uniref:Protein kinase domain-containing protein n=1 Tax=Cryobacterium frigoriphilum TaxID=1259150 RepID=A0A4R8ZZU1_9MICO|nr:protein kinase [Cryobacterium frigoriphilum]TFD49675.1 hypothetical protein E3T55_11440 [Cryobacterium frigoriphilum]
MRIYHRSHPSFEVAPPAAEGTCAAGVPDSIPASIAGYSVVRRLGEGRRSDIYLGHSPLGDAVRGDSSANGSQVALKVYRAHIDTDSVEREITALTESRTGLAHLIDVATLGDGRVCLVLQRIRGDSLAHYLTKFGPLCPGEAVTILAPVVVALRQLHSTGLVHRGLSQASILIDERGRPVLLGLGSLATVPASGADRVALLRADYARLTVLLAGVLGDVVDDLVGNAGAGGENRPGQAGVSGSAALLARCESAASAAVFVACLEQIERHLFDWAPALALSYGRNTTAGAGAAVVAAVPRLSTALDTHPRNATSQATRLRLGQHVGQHVGQRLGLPADAAELLSSVTELGRYVSVRLTTLNMPRVHGRSRGTGTGTDRGRPQAVARRWSRVIYALSLATAATIAAFVLLPAVAPNRPDGSSAQATAPAQAPVMAPVMAPSDAATLASDDPVAAARVLLTLRAQCLATASLACLAVTDQPDGPLMAADVDSIRHSQQGLSAANEAQPARAAGHLATVELVERTGNSALIALVFDTDKPASALMIRGETGWRLRELFDY